jgi:hypothetical protein
VRFTTCYLDYTFMAYFSAGETAVEATEDCHFNILDMQICIQLTSTFLRNGGTAFDKPLTIRDSG